MVIKCHVFSAYESQKLHLWSVSFAMACLNSQPMRLACFEPSHFKLAWSQSTFQVGWNAFWSGFALVIGIVGSVCVCVCVCVCVRVMTAWWCTLVVPIDIHILLHVDREIFALKYFVHKMFVTLNFCDFAPPQKNFNGVASSMFVKIQKLIN